MKGFFKKILGIKEETKDTESIQEKSIEFIKKEETLALDEKFAQNFTNAGGKFIYCLDEQELLESLNFITREVFGRTKKIRLTEHFFTYFDLPPKAKTNERRNKKTGESKPTNLSILKACMVKDLDAMEQLGMYEVAPEDFSLTEFVCISKQPHQEIIREGFDLMIKEIG